LTATKNLQIAAKSDNETVLSALLVGLIGLTLIEAVELFVNKATGNHWLRIRFILYGEWMFLPASAWVAWLSLRLGARGLLLAGATYTICFVLMTQFRGLWLWGGTFDRYESSKVSWLFPVGVGLAVALTIYCLHKQKTMQATSPNLTNTLLSLFCGSVIVSALMQNLYPIGSVFAPTRIYGLAAALVVLATACLVSRRVTQ
jgi:hypothetical protein